MKNIKQKLCECRHCGNKGYQNILAKDVIEETDEQGRSLFHIPRWLLKCPVCEGLTIIEYFDPENEEYILYPEPMINRIGIPKKIYNAFCSAEKTQYIDSTICAIALRRTLELICIDKGAKEDDLVKMITELSKTNIFPKNIEMVATIIRKIGNLGAHTDICFDTWEIKRLLKLVSSILSYLYTIPNELTCFYNKIKETKKSKK